jgi:hypothetical protein
MVHSLKTERIGGSGNKSSRCVYPEGRDAHNIALFENVLSYFHLLESLPMRAIRSCLRLCWSPSSTFLPPACVGAAPAAGRTPDQWVERPVNTDRGPRRVRQNHPVERVAFPGWGKHAGGLALARWGRYRSGAFPALPECRLQHCPA